MPRQEFVLSYLLTPQFYESEVIGVSIPLSFSAVDIDGYVLTYSPVMAFDGYTMRDSLFADRTLDEGMVNALQALANKKNEYSVHITYSKQADKTEQWASSQQEILLAERTLEAEAVMILQSIRANINRHYEADVFHLIDSEYQLKRSHEAAKLWNMTADNKREHDFQVLLHVILAEDKTLREGLAVKLKTIRGTLVRKSDALIQLLFREAEEKAPIDGQLNAGLSADTLRVRVAAVEAVMEQAERNREGTLMTRVIRAIRDNYGARIVHKIKWSERDGRGALMVTRMKQAARRLREALRVIRMGFGNKRDDEGQLDNEVIYASITYRYASEMARVIAAGFSGRDAKRIDDVLKGDKQPRISLLDHPVIYAKYGGKESAIYKSLVTMEKYGVASRFIKDLQLASKYERDSVIRQDTTFGDEKGVINSLIEKLRMGSGKKEIETRAIEKWILATLSPWDFVIEKLLEYDKLSHDTLIHIMEQAEVPDPEGICHAIMDMGTNIDMPNRPAGMLETKLGWWDIGFDELLEEWHGKDYLSPPSKDYDYSQNITQVYDSNGVPLNPLSATNLADVDISMPVTHPIPLYQDVGSQEAWVDLYTFQDMCLLMAITLKQETAKFAGMTGQQALQYVLGKLYEMADEAFPWSPEYKRMFRFIRWYAETLTHKESITVLHRSYDDWRDDIAVNGGQLLTPHIKSQVALLPSGVIEATSSNGYLQFTIENFIDGEFTLSVAVTSSDVFSSSHVSVYVDGELTEEFYRGTSRRTIVVPAGIHTYHMVYERVMGDEIKISGLVISGVRFIEAHTTQRDNGEVRGLRVVRALIDNLLEYYRAHHKKQVKGAEGIKQRKIWLT